MIWKIYLMAITIIIGMVSCEKKYYYVTENPSETDANKDNNNSSDTNNPTDDDKDNDEGDSDDEEQVWAYSPSDVLKMTTGTDVLLVGYVVGVSKATSLKSAIYVPPFSYSNNIILADTLYEGVPLAEDKQIHVVLTSPTSKAMRQELNLQDHPELYNKQLLISGIVDTYNKRIAVKGVYDYQIIE